MAQTTERKIPTTEPVADRSIVISRIFEAPRELVFGVFTSPEHVPQWWGPNGFTLTTQHMDVRPGGEWLFVMHGPDGTDYANKIAYTEVVPPERLRYTHSDPGDASYFEVTVTMEQLGDRQTKLTMNSVFPTIAARDFVVKEFHAIEGGNQTLARMAAHIESMQKEPRG